VNSYRLEKLSHSTDTKTPSLVLLLAKRAASPSGAVHARAAHLVCPLKCDSVTCL